MACRSPTSCCRGLRSMTAKTRSLHRWHGLRCKTLSLATPDALDKLCFQPQSRWSSSRSEAARIPIPGIKASSIAAGTPYSKELKLLAHVFETAEAGNPVSVCEAIEHFGEGVLNPAGQWLKVAGRHKATVLAKSMKLCPRGGSILEIGTYCGYSAIRMANALPGARIVSLEVDPAHVVIARNMIAFAGLAHMVDVWTGHSKDLLPRLPARYGGPEKFKLCGVFMDQKGTRYDEDLALIERMGLLLPGAVIVADNVLKPGSPLFLWRLIRGSAYDNHVVRVREFAMPAEDWMSVSVLRSDAAATLLAESKEEASRQQSRGKASAAGECPEAPQELVQLQWESDRIRAQATRPGSGSVSFSDWAAYAEKMKERMGKYGIVETADAADLEAGAELWPAGAVRRHEGSES
eukprot:TRINITY_DN92321_c0_g1_i1.p1 TRINITY_DN92321_c0_g1~~TRINITY_DN92321_c0_g1_i1.p1  ORF type:complete len:419 (-),score=76.54 TRINITY_DN92321_c0_g1_i1:42-1262(-)